MSTTDLATLSVNVHPGDSGDEPALVMVHGDVDIAGASELEQAMRVAATMSDRVVVDMAEVPFMDSSGFNALLEGHRAGATIAVRSATPSVRRLLQLLGVPGIIDLED